MFSLKGIQEIHETVKIIGILFKTIEYDLLICFQNPNMSAFSGCTLVVVSNNCSNSSFYVGKRVWLRVLKPSPSTYHGYLFLNFISPALIIASFCLSCGGFLEYFNFGSHTFGDHPLVRNVCMFFFHSVLSLSYCLVNGFKFKCDKF